MRMKGKRVFITGASSGIGEACARAFAQEGADLLLCARRQERLEALAADLRSTYPIEAIPLVLDVRDKEAVQHHLGDLPTEWQAVDVLINNAGLALGIEKIQEANMDNWERMIDTNIKGVLYVTQHVVAKMLERQQGHIINIGSVSSYNVYPGGAVYCATKYALRAISDGLKMDVHGTPIRVSQVNPGMVETEFSVVRFDGDKARADAVYEGVIPLSAEDVADAVCYCATRPPHVDVCEILIKPTDQTATHMCYRRSEK